jgi:hypothetical protein
MSTPLTKVRLLGEKQRSKANLNDLRFDKSGGSGAESPGVRLFFFFYFLILFLKSFKCQTVCKYEIYSYGRIFTCEK